MSIFDNYIFIDNLTFIVHSDLRSENNINCYIYDSYDDSNEPIQKVKLVYCIVDVDT